MGRSVKMMAVLAQHARVCVKASRVTGEDRQRQFVAIGRSRSASKLSWPSAGLRERLLSPSRLCSAALTTIVSDRNGEWSRTRSRRRMTAVL